jgi:hypothetical protein
VSCGDSPPVRRCMLSAVVPSRSGSLHARLGTRKVIAARPSHGGFARATGLHRSTPTPGTPRRPAPPGRHEPTRGPASAAGDRGLLRRPLGNDSAAPARESAGFGHHVQILRVEEDAGAGVDRRQRAAARSDHRDSLLKVHGPLVADARHVRHVRPAQPGARPLELGHEPGCAPRRSATARRRSLESRSPRPTAHASSWSGAGVSADPRTQTLPTLTHSLNLVKAPARPRRRIPIRGIRCIAQFGDSFSVKSIVALVP